MQLLAASDAYTADVIGANTSWLIRHSLLYVFGIILIDLISRFKTFAYPITDPAVQTV